MKLYGIKNCDTMHAEGDRTIGRVPLNGLVRIRQHLDTDRGLELDTRATVGVYGAHGVLAGVFAQAARASEKHFQAYYGVRESACSTSAAAHTQLGQHAQHRSQLRRPGAVDGDLARRLHLPARAFVLRAERRGEEREQGGSRQSGRLGARAHRKSSGRIRS
jgi:hypothetical protein